ncbi:MAG TPA: Uma2 family endonuclease [Gemmataceae bacterium]|nr:Uma2 family endonuclease [Gemmataceae bacterium]
MNSSPNSTENAGFLPTHLDLPFEDNIPHNFFDFVQARLLTNSVELWFKQKRATFKFLIGRDNYIYWGITTPPTLGAKAPDWFLVEHRPRLLDGIWRNSYVLWQERVIPTVIMEFISETPGGEWDTTPRTGKFWVYEQGIKAPHYIIWDPWNDKLAAFRLVQGRYQKAQANERGHYPIESLGLEYGLWHGKWNDEVRLWLRFWDDKGELLLDPDELSAQLQLRADQAELQARQAVNDKVQAEQDKRKAFDKLRELGIDPDKLP